MKNFIKFYGSSVDFFDFSKFRKVFRDFYYSIFFNFFVNMRRNKLEKIKWRIPKNSLNIFLWVRLVPLIFRYLYGASRFLFNFLQFSWYNMQRKKLKKIK